MITIKKKLCGVIVLVLMTVGIVGCGETTPSLERSYDEYIASNGSVKSATETKKDSTTSSAETSATPQSEPIMTLYPDGEFRINGTTYFYNGLINSDTISFQQLTYKNEYITVSSYYHASIGSEFIFNKVNVKAKIIQLDAMSGKISLELSMP